MSRQFEVTAGTPAAWPRMPEAASVVASFLARVRVTGDPVAAGELMAPLVECHQVVSDAPETIRRTPAEYAEHVREMLAHFGPFRYTVTELLAEDDRVYVRWRQDGHHLLTDAGEPGTGRPVSDVGSAVYRVADGRIAEYWIQLDRLGLQRQLDPGAG